MSADSDVQEPRSADQEVNNVDFGRDVELGALLDRLQYAPGQIKLQEINSYFNAFVYRSDGELWKRPDHWATPVEFLARGAGDCEDFAISKYFALRSLGIPDEQLHIAYVFDTDVNASHMIVIYSRPGVPDLVLDNRTPEILSLHEQHHLVPVYGFNSSGIFMFQGTKRVSVGSHRKRRYFHPQWRKILKKMPAVTSPWPRVNVSEPVALKIPG